MSKDTFSLFVTCGQGLEPLLIEELAELGIKKVEASFRGVFIEEWDWDTIYTINYASRIGSRVLLPLKQFRCFDKDSLYLSASEIDWTRIVKKGKTIAIDANVQHRELRNSLFAAQIVKDAICDQLREKEGWRPNVDIQGPDIQLNLFIQNQFGVISFDTSGQPLHKRGYRQETVEAPIQESLAAACLRLAKYKKEDVLFDPCCGSGTFLIEAAMIASQTAPGSFRNRWGFMTHPDYSSERWLHIKNQFDAKRTSLSPRHFFGIDISRNAARAAKINIRSAGFGQFIDIQQANFREYSPTVPPTLMLANPPYGRRLDEESLLVPLYKALGDFMKNQCAKPSKGFILTGSIELGKQIGLAAKRRYVLSNGGIEARLLEFEIY